MQTFRQEMLPLMDSRPVDMFSNNASSPFVMVTPHWHYACEVLLIRRGWGRQQLNTSMFPFHAGDLIFIRPCDIHATEAAAPDGCDIDVLQFLPSVLGRFEAELESLPSRLITSADGEIVRLFGQLTENTREPDPRRQDMAACGLLLLLAGALKYARNARTAAVASETVASVRAWLEETTDWSLARAADRFGYSPEHLSRKFHAETGIPFRQYCEQLRMRRALAWLEQGLSLSAIAEKLVYSDTGSFIRAFRRIYGLTPSAYRRLYLQDPVRLQTRRSGT